MTQATKPALQVFLVDDHDAVRRGLALLIEHEGMKICGQAADRATALAGLAQVACDVAVVDLTLGEDSGVDLLRELRARRPELALLVYSMHEARWEIEAALAAGARGYVTKRDSAECLGRGIAEVAAGRTYFSPRVVEVATEALVIRARPVRGVESLSTQEQRVYSLLGEGATTAEMAAQLSLSPRTVQSYCARILEKLGLSGMRELRRQAIAARQR